MAIFKKALPVFFIALIACFPCPAAPAGEGGRDVRIGLIGADPIRVLQDFDPFVEYLRDSLRSSSIRDVTVFVARDLDQMRSRIQHRRLDFVLTTAYPVIEMTPLKLVPAVVALQEGGREDSAVFFVRTKSPLRNLGELGGKTIAFGTPSSTAAYALAVAELKKSKLSTAEWTDEHAPEDAVRYRFAGEAINQAFRVIRYRADAGVMSGIDWEGLPPNVQARLRIIHRTAPVTRLFGSFSSSVPPALRDVVEQALVGMSGSRRGRRALTMALQMTAFERLTEEDRNSLQRLTQQLQEAD